MKIIIRQECEKDFLKVNHLTFLAFENMEFADGDEQELVAKLRNSEDFIPELSLVAEFEGEIVGHILFTASRILNGNKIVRSLALAPVSVHPSFQRKGIGSQLIKEGLSIAIELGHTNVNVVGHPEYYPKFGFTNASNFGITFSVEVPEGVFMFLELKKNSLKGVAGKLHYAKEFGLETKK